MHTGSIIDFYDDPSGQVLKARLPQEMPDFIKTAQFLNEDQRAKLPDDVFALVMVDQGECIKKYACTDKGNTALSVIYFLENHHKLPEEAQKVAAANLVTACGWYDMEPPHQLQKLAGLLGWGLKKAIKHPIATYSAVKGVGEIKSKVDEGMARHQEMMQPKMSELSGTKLMPGQSDRPEDEEKTGSLHPYVDITGQRAPERFEKVASQQTLLNGRFPVDSYGEVEQARQWFEDYGSVLHPLDRRDFCTKLAARADELGMDVTEKIAKYAGKGYAQPEELEAAVCTRMQYWADDSPERDMLKSLMEKKAEVPPEVFCEALRQLDETTGLNHHWDEGVVDPWYATFGKTAGAGWTFEYLGDRVDEDMLKKVSVKDRELIKKKFGCEFAEEFQKKPREIFDSLPLDTKRIIMRMANDPQP